jgi:hypothetical protein
MALPAALGALAAKAAGSKALGTAATTLGITGMNQFLKDRAFRKEKQWWKEQFDYSAKYDTPKAQIERMKEAGLNPALMYGGSGSVAGAPSPTGGNMEAASGELSSLGLMSGEVKNLQKELALKDATEQLINAQSANELQKGAVTGAQAKVANELVQSNINLGKLQVQMRQEEVIGKMIDNQIKDNSKSAIVKKALMDAMRSAAEVRNLEGRTAGQYLDNIEKSLKNQLLETGVVPGGLVGDIISIFKTAMMNVKTDIQAPPLKVTGKKEQEQFYRE